MEASFNLCNLEGRKKVLSCSISINNFPLLFNTFILKITLQRPFWGIPRSSSKNESIACDVDMRESGDILEDAEVLGMAFMSHQGSLRCGGKMAPPSLYSLWGRMETGSQVTDFLFLNILLKGF